MRVFKPEPNAIWTQAAIDIEAAPERVAAVYWDVERWGATFPATIERAKIIKVGENWKEIEVTHRQEGQVPNTLIDLSKYEVGLQESKRKFDAGFLNRFEPRPGGGTHVVIDAYIRLKGIYPLLQPFLRVTCGSDSWTCCHGKDLMDGLEIKRFQLYHALLAICKVNLNPLDVQ